MRNLKTDIKAILKNKCLTQEEKNKLKNIFKNFMATREIQSRKPINFEYDEDRCNGLDSILRRV